MNKEISKIIRLAISQDITNKRALYKQYGEKTPPKNVLDYFNIDEYVTVSLIAKELREALSSFSLNDRCNFIDHMRFNFHPESTYLRFPVYGKWKKPTNVLEKYIEHSSLYMEVVKLNKRTIFA